MSRSHHWFHTVVTTPKHLRGVWLGCHAWFLGWNHSCDGQAREEEEASVYGFNISKPSWTSGQAREEDAASVYWYSMSKQ